MFDNLNYSLLRKGKYFKKEINQFMKLSISNKKQDEKNIINTTCDYGF